MTRPPDGLAQAAADYWNKEVVEQAYSSWTADLQVRARINTMVTGDRHTWPLDWFAHRLPKPFERGLSIGCGPGHLERQAIRLGICRRIDGLDISEESLAAARRTAEEEGMADAIRYARGDFNNPSLPRNKYDIVFFGFSLHHVAKLEKLFRHVLRALRPDGVVYFEEYVGPSASEWNPERLRTPSTVYALLPREWRIHETLPMPVNLSDPSEAIRSSEILRQLRVGFEIVEKRDFGGNLLAILYQAIDWDVAPREAVGLLLEAEQALLASGEESFYSVVVARPVRGAKRLLARARYFFVPKHRRAWRAVRKHS